MTSWQVERLVTSCQKAEGLVASWQVEKLVTSWQVERLVDCLAG